MKRKMHRGSVEGLVWGGMEEEVVTEEERMKMVSVGADHCVTHLWTLSKC